MTIINPPRNSFDLSNSLNFTVNGDYYDFDINFAFEKTDDLSIILDTGTAISLFSATPNINSSDGGVVSVLASTLAGANIIYIYRDMAFLRETEFQADSDFRAAVINGEFDRMTWLLQQMNMSVDNSLHAPLYDDGISLELPSVVDRKNKLLGFAPDGAPMALDDSVQSATNALNSANSAAASAGSAAASLIAADSARDLAEAAVEKMGWSDVIFVDASVSTTYTITDASVGKMFSFDCTDSDITVNLDAISSLSLLDSGNNKTAWAVGLIKRDSSGNQVIINPAGSDTIGGDISLTIGTRNSGVTLVPDADLTPDIWTPMRFGAVSGNMTVDRFVAGIDYAANASTLTLSLAPGNIANVLVTFDGVAQHRSTMTLSDSTLTFGAAIPASVIEIEVWIGTTISIGVPADGTITEAKLAPGLTLGGPKLGTNSIMRTNAPVINENITVPAATNAMSIGPITIATGKTVTLTAGSTWRII